MVLFATLSCPVAEVFRDNSTIKFSAMAPEDRGPVSLRLMTSQFKYIVTQTQKYNTLKCIFCGVWVQNFVGNAKSALWNFTQQFEPIHWKICILQGVENFTNYDTLKLWHLKVLVRRAPCVDGQSPAVSFIMQDKRGDLNCPRYLSIDDW